MGDGNECGDRENLTREYERMSDLELLEIAVKEEKLADLEREILARELAKRGLISEAQDEAGAEEQAPQVSGPLVVVKRFTTLAAASLAKSILDSAKIDSILTGEKIMGMVYPNLVGAVKLMVRSDDLDSAIQLLSQTETATTEDDEETDLTKILRRAAQQNPSGDKES